MAKSPFGILCTHLSGNLAKSQILQTTFVHFNLANPQSRQLNHTRFIP
jgi:hypothetical protein